MSNQSDEKGAAYYHVLNHALLHLIPVSATHVLDVGCASGYLGEAIKQKTGGQVSGIELFEGAAREAETRLDFVLCGNIEMVELPFKEAQFDAVVFGDVLEHMLDPWSVIRKLSPYIKVGGGIFASIPNVGHITIIEQLLNGTWTYTEAGLLDKTHFRFFTKNEINKLFEDNGFNVSSISQLMNTHERENQLIKELAEVGKKYGLATADLNERATAFQYIVNAVKVGSNE
ncbi:glycosyltransferase, family 2 [Bacillus sp. JCM 19046]|nr:glycosyltransferase, family 2 [Bacillus sp. JCM 19045]GAF17834.1 glycosyltransferase, family 2 [Bacillus sp. JCM 19046]